MKAELLRSPIPYYGGKGNMLKRLLPLIPTGGKPYLEPYFGGGSVFFARDPAPVEVVNDIDGDVITIMRVLQDKEQFEELRHRLMWTPYARGEFERAIEMRYDPHTTGVDRAWSVMVTQNMGMSGALHKTAGTWRRAFTAKGGVAGTVNSWLMRLTMLDAWRWRLMMAQIDNRCAIEVIKYWDNPEMVCYCDPPYHADTRVGGAVYTHESTDDHHSKLTDTLLGCSGAIVLSCYDHPVYDPLAEAGWKKHQFKTSCHAVVRSRGSSFRGVGAASKNAPRVETVWLNPKAAALVGTAKRTSG